MATSRPSITLRPARPDDLPDLLAIEAASFTGDRLSRRALRRWLRVPYGRCLVAERAGAIVAYGLASLHRAGRVARIYSLAVAPGARGSGLGGRLGGAEGGGGQRAGGGADGGGGWGSCCRWRWGGSASALPDGRFPARSLT